ncbi:MAG: hypothetical protein U0166_18210 [Acidobacteriota bacterium]
MARRERRGAPGARAVRFRIRRGGADRAQTPPRAGRIERRRGRVLGFAGEPLPPLDPTRAQACVAELAATGIPILARIALSGDPAAAADRASSIVAVLGPTASAFTISLPRGEPPERWTACVARVVDAARAASRPVLLCADPVDPAGWIDAGVSGFVVEGSARREDGRCVIGSPAREGTLAGVRRLREACGDAVVIIGSGGVHQPSDARSLRDAGADLVAIDSGLVFTGPSLPKRINDALLHDAQRGRPPGTPGREAEMSWFWTGLMGLGMLFGSVLALAIAATRVVLPYDESFVGMTRAELRAVNPRLLPFMTHDRVTLAGTMVGIGAMYAGLSYWGARRGRAWARKAILLSAGTGFASFFLFLGFGYLDPLHSFVTAALLQLMLLGIAGKLADHVPGRPPELSGDAAWRRALWGQLLLIVHGVALLGAGVVICSVGVSRVFVVEDLAFMGTTAGALADANARLVPLVAHDRATFGGMLLSAGWVFMLPAMWGFERGARWLFWTLALAGLPAYAAAIGVHYAVGYTDPWHLVPAFGGLALFACGLLLSRSHLCSS